MVHHPGGDWNPGWGVDLRYTIDKGLYISFNLQKPTQDEPLANNERFRSGFPKKCMYLVILQDDEESAWMGGGG